MQSKNYLIGGGIGSLAAAAFMIRDGGVAGEHITIFEASAIMGGSLDGAGDPVRGYSLRGGRMLTTDNYECTWDLFKSIPSLTNPAQSVFDETVAFNKLYKAHSMARLVNRQRAKVPVAAMGFSMRDRKELLILSNTKEAALGASCITDWLSPSFFDTEFWAMWATTFAFQPWHSAVEFKRYLHRFMLEFTRIDTLAGVKRTIYNQYDSLVLPLQAWLEAQGVQLLRECRVTDLQNKIDGDKFVVTGIHYLQHGTGQLLTVDEGDLVFLQNGSMTDASTLGSMTTPPDRHTKVDSQGWTLWEKLADGRPDLGNPAAFNSNIAQSSWESFTVTLQDTTFFDLMKQPIERVNQLVNLMRQRFPASEVNFIDTVCQPTKQRQTAAVELAQQCEVVIVVGGAHSNNTRELVATCQRYCTQVHHVQTAADLRREWFENTRTIGLTAGTSTPDAVIDAVEQAIARLTSWKEAA